MTMLAELARRLEDVPGCGTRFPGFHRPHPHPDVAAALRETRRTEFEADYRVVIVSALECARLYQIGQGIGGERGKMLGDAAQQLFDDSPCGSVPLSDLIRLIVGHWPPPPPSPWLREVEAAASAYTVASHGIGMEKAREAAWESLLCRFCFFPCGRRMEPLEGPVGGGTPHTGG
jgi:hypothetical protein